MLDLIGLCTEVRDVEVCCNSNTQTEIAKREIVLIDASMTTVSFFPLYKLIKSLINFVFNLDNIKSVGRKC